MIRILYLLLPACIAVTSLNAAGPTTRGKIFWMAFMENTPLTSNGPPAFSFYVSCDVNTSGVIEAPATGYSQSFTAVAGQVTEVFLPAGIFYPVGSESVTNYGLRITSQDSIRLSVQHHRLYYSEASLVLPVGELGSGYMVTAHEDDLGNSSQTGLPQFTVIATEDNTTLDITPAALTVGFRPPGIPFSVTLNKGQVYQVQSYGDLTGTTVSARDKKAIAVFSGATYANVQCLATNHLYDQLYPLEQWGNEYLVVPFLPAGAPSEFRIVASQNGTRVFINCNAPVVLNKGEHMDYLSSSPVRITATAPIAVGQFKQGQLCGSEGDATFLEHKPNGFKAHKVTFESMQSAIPNFQYTQHFVNIVVKASTAALVALDNNPVTFSPFPANPGYSYARVALTAGTHTLVSDSGFYAYVYGVGTHDSYSYLAGYDEFHPAAAGLLTMTHTDTLCSAGPIAFTGNYPPGASAWYWNFGEGNSASAQNTTHAYGSAGTYTVTLTALDAATGCPSVAQEVVQVERCFYSEDCELFVPEGFSPNGDGINDKACVYGACITQMEFTIYDRWGEVVFRANSQADCWDGTRHGQMLDHAVFAWTLKATLLSGTEITKSGNITLIR